MLTEQNMWVRNFDKSHVSYLDINKTITDKDHFIFLENEVQNGLNRMPWIDSEPFYHENIIIVSDGFDFKTKQTLLSKIPSNIAIIGVNGSLSKWEVPNRSLSYYVANNPYEECMRYLPKRAKILPKCIASVRTNYKFLQNYRGTKYRYYPVNECNYTTLGMKEVKWQIDDYRNVICAAIGLSYKFGASRVLLFCCDNTFKDERPGAIKLENGLWMYPQQEIAHGLIDGNLYWLKNQPYQEVMIGNYSSGPKYENASYINEGEIMSFFGMDKHE